MKLYPHQSEAVATTLPILQFHKLVYLVMEVRTGKTLTALTTAQQYLHDKNDLVAFVTKKKAIPSIQQDYDRGNFSFYLKVINYEALHHLNEQPALWIIDEAHACGQYPNPSQRTKALKEKINGAPCILLSGTPTPESYSQIYHQLWITGNSPFDYKNFYAWAKDGYVTIKQKMVGGFKKNDYSCANIAAITNVINHLLVSCSQQDAGFENEVVETIVPVSMNEVSKFLYKEIEKNQVVEYGGRTFIADTPANMINKLSQISGGTLIDDEGNALTFDDTKAHFIKSTYQGKKLAIYYKYKAEYNLLSTTFPKHTTDWSQFENEDIPVFLCQIQSGREGISLRSADLIIMYNIDFSATSYWQARARMQYRDRVGACEIHWLFSDLGIEARVYEAVSKKKNFTVSYYKKYEHRSKNTGKGKEKAIGSWMDSSKDNVVQPAGMAGLASTQGRTDDFYRMQSPRKASDGTAKVPTQCTPCDWL